MMNKLQRSSITGAILAGGRAQRMNGLAKGMIRIGTLSNIERLKHEFQNAGIHDLVLVANETRPYAACGLPVISDLRKGIGPIGGIETGLSYYSQHTHAVLFVPCDLPNISCVELIKLKASFTNSEAPVLFAQTGAFFWHPLCVVVHIDVLESISAAINCGCRKISDVWCQVGAQACTFDDEAPFFNINTHTDWETWRKHYAGSSI